MTTDEFRALLAGGDEGAMLEATLRSDAPPFVFDTAPARWTEFKAALSGQLAIKPEQIRIVGSGRLGFSLKPGANLKAFTDRSDIDVVIVSEEAFDEMWHMLLLAAYPRPPVVYGKKLVKMRNELYTGYLTPLNIGFDSNLRLPRARTEPFLRERTKWFNTLQTASQIPPRRHEGVNCRLYRSWRHAELYTMDSVANLKRTLQ